MTNEKKNDFLRKKYMIEERGEIILAKRELKELKKSYKVRKKLQLSKFLAIFIMAIILINCFLIEVFSAWAMIQTGNLDSLSTLINTALGSCLLVVLDFCIYSIKAYNETKQEEAIKLERDKYFSNDDGIDAEINYVENMED